MQNQTNSQDEKDNNQVQEQLKQIYKIQPEIPTSKPVKGYDFNGGIDWEKIIDSYETFGLQSSHLYQAIEQVKKMISWRLSDEKYDEEKDGEDYKDEEVRKNTRCTIFLGYTSNMVSSGVREIIRYLCQHKMIDCIVSSAGGVEEDFIKCLSDFYLGSWNCDDKQLRLKSQNRIGNILVPSENYCKLEDWLIPIFKEMYEDQIKNQNIYSPSKVIRKLGEKINNENSIYYWCYKNDIPVFCPAITDGAIGDMLFYFSYKCSGFILDLVEDIRQINKIVLKAKKSGVLVLGGGVVKHHILNANIWRNGADYGVFINTGLQYDGSDAGAMISEALSWGKLQLDSSYVKVWSEASLVFPLLVGKTFAKYEEMASKLTKEQRDEMKKNIQEKNEQSKNKEEKSQQNKDETKNQQEQNEKQETDDSDKNIK